MLRWSSSLGPSPADRYMCLHLSFWTAVSLYSDKWLCWAELFLQEIEPLTDFLPNQIRSFVTIPAATEADAGRRSDWGCLTDHAVGAKIPLLFWTNIYLLLWKKIWCFTWRLTVFYHGDLMVSIYDRCVRVCGSRYGAGTHRGEEHHNKSAGSEHTHRTPTHTHTHTHTHARMHLHTHNHIRTDAHI